SPGRSAAPWLGSVNTRAGPSAHPAEEPTPRRIVPSPVSGWGAGGGRSPSARIVSGRMGEMAPSVTSIMSGISNCRQGGMTGAPEGDARERLKGEEAAAEELDDLPQSTARVRAVNA